MLKRILSFYKTSQPSSLKVSAEKVDGYYKKLRIQAFIAGTLGYSLYYVCRTSLNVMKQPIIDSGFLADHSNIKKFMATGLIVSASYQGNFLWILQCVPQFR